MHSYLRFGTFCVLVFMLLHVSISAFADSTPRYSLIDLGVDFGGSFGGAIAMNQAGDVVGFGKESSTNYSRAYVWTSKKHVQRLPLIEAGQSAAQGINDNGLIVGCETSTPHNYALVWSFDGTQWNAHQIGANMQCQAVNNAGQIVGVVLDTRGAFIYDTTNGMRTLPSLGGNSTGATGINNSGVAAGYTRDPSNHNHAVIWDPVTGIRDLGTLGGPQATAQTINDAGVVVGQADTAAGVNRAFIWDRTNGIRDVGAPNGADCQASGINAKNQVVGRYQTPSGASHASLWSQKSGFLDLNDLVDGSAAGWVLASAYVINDKGWITGDGYYNGKLRPFLLKPSNVAQVFANRLYFQTKDQSVWYPGVGRIQIPNEHWDGFVGPQWNIAPTIGGFFPIVIGGWDLWFIHIPAISLGEFGLKMALSSQGRAGLQVNAFADGGSVNLTYPVVVKLQFPDAGTVATGDTFPISASYYTDPSARFSTSNISAYAQLDAILKADNAANLEAKAFSKSLFKGQLLPGAIAHVDTSKNLFKSDADLKNGTWQEDFSILDGLVNGHVQIPRLSMAGTVDQTSSDLHQIQGNIKAPFFSVSGNVSGLIARLFGIPLSLDFPIGFEGGGADIGASVLALNAGARVSFSQKLTFAPVPRVHLEFSNGYPPMEFNADETVYVTMPSDPQLTITPTIWLPNNFTNSTSLNIDGSLNFAPLRLYGSASAFGYNLLNFDVTPFKWDVGGGLADIPIYNRTFELPGLQHTTVPPITILGRRAVAPTLSGVTPSSQDFHILAGAVPKLADFQAFVAGNTVISISGANFNPEDTQVYLSCHGAIDVPLDTYVVSPIEVQATLPNWYRLLPGTARLVVTNTYGRSNSLDLDISYPAPKVATVGPNLWASDPHFRDIIITVEPDNTGLPADVGTTYIRRLDYFQFIRDFWAATSGLPTPNAGDFFKTFDFTADAILPAVHWNGVPSTDPIISGDVLGKYVEPTPSGLLVSLLPNASFDRPMAQIPVHIINPGPGGGASNVVYATVGALTPVVTSVTPNQAAPGSTAVQIQVKGPSDLAIPGHPNDNKAANFVGSSVVYWNGQPRPTHFVSTGELHADIPASDLSAGAINTVTVVTLGIASPTSNGMSFTVANPSPQLGGLWPARAITSDPAFDRPGANVSLSGTGFVPTSIVTWNGNTLPAGSVEFASDRILRVTLPSTAVAQPGTVELKVQNPAPGGGTSNSSNLTIKNAAGGPATSNEALWFTQISPAKSTPGASAFPLLVGGANGVGTRLGNGFCPQSVVQLNGKPLPTTYNQSSSIYANIAPPDIATPGIYNVTVFNPAPGGGVSAPLTLTVDQNGAPIKSLVLTPNAVTGGTGSSGKITLAKAATAAGAITLANSDTTAATVPSSVPVSAGQTVVTFNITTVPVSSVHTAVITATYAGNSRLAGLTIGTPKPKSVGFSPTTVTGGSTVTEKGTVTLETAPLVDTVVNLAPTLGVDALDPADFPASVTVLAGQTSATFMVKTVAVAASTLVNVSATVGGGEAFSKFTVRAPIPTTLMFSPNPVKGGSAVNVTVGLDAAPAVDTTVTLVSNNGIVTFDGSSSTTVTIPKGSQTTTFPGVASTSKPGAIITAQITATVNGVAKSANLKITP